MQSVRFNVKFYLADPQAVELDEFVPVFHEWVSEHRLDEVLIDVAHYGHVPDGPGIVLIGHEAHYAMDLRDGALGLSYSRKRGAAEGELPARITHAFRKALGAAYQLERAPQLEGRVRFEAAPVWFCIQDRLGAPNDDDTFAAVRPALTSVLDALYQGQPYELEPEPDPRKVFGVRIRADVEADVETLLGRL